MESKDGSSGSGTNLRYEPQKSVRSQDSTFGSREKAGDLGVCEGDESIEIIPAPCPGKPVEGVKDLEGGLLACAHAVGGLILGGKEDCVLFPEIPPASFKIGEQSWGQGHRFHRDIRNAGIQPDCVF